MSLLLDALKKAAQEKQNSDTAEDSPDAIAGLTLHQTADQQQAPAHSFEDPADEPIELELQDEGLALSADIEAVASEGHVTRTEEVLAGYRITPTPSTVTDEALELLVHKSNRAYKKSRLMTWGGVVAASLVLLTASGLYLYFDMLAEIAMMQRKHQIALATLKSKTKIEENLTSLAAVSESGIQAQTEKRREKKTARLATVSQTTSSNPHTNQTGTQTFSVHKERKPDPLSDTLQRGWAAYQNKEYEVSGRAYRRVLDQEPDNRDALLGLAAVSLQQDDIDTAKDMYLHLLELDPRDAHAHAGMGQIAQKTGADLSEEKLKQLIEYQPDDAHLQFTLGNLYIQKKSWPQAQQAFFNAWKADSQNPDYAYNLAVSLDHLGKHKAAKALYRDSLKLAAGKNVSFSEEAVKSRLAHLGALP
jgi:tetratricopeptide (TPR) repeat protein